MPACDNGTCPYHESLVKATDTNTKSIEILDKGFKSLGNRLDNISGWLFLHLIVDSLLGVGTFLIIGGII